MTNTSFQANQFKKICIAITIALALVIGFSFQANAQEINPAPGTYVYGSSSELSPYSALSPGSSSGTLASTGQNSYIGYIAIGASLVVAGSIVLYLYKSSRKKYQ